MNVSEFVDFRRKLIENVGQVIIGKNEIIELHGIAFISDVKYMAPYVLNHRVIHKGMNKNSSLYEYIETVLKNSNVPLENVQV